MGLDMYAYAIKKELIGNAQTDVNVHHVAFNAIGYTQENTDGLCEPERTAVYQRRNAALKAVKDSGIFNEDFYYWRKFNNLHGWMHRLYDAKGGKSHDFNCDTLVLTSEDFDKLEADLLRQTTKNESLFPPESGFFFGNETELDTDDVDSIMDFIKKSRAAIADGFAIVYDSWW